MVNTLKILSWNINGIRSIKVPLVSFLNSLEADIICFQETKITRDQVDEATAIVEGYNSYFSFSRKKSGYSGVATFCRDTVTPVAAEEGLGGILPTAGDDIVGDYPDKSSFSVEELQALDSEGRTIITKHVARIKDCPDEKHVAVINVYCPALGPDKQERKAFKLRFYDLLQRRAEALLDRGYHVIIVGDLNTLHKPIDHCEPGSCENFLKSPSRRWMDQFLCSELGSQNCDKHGKFVDTFRHFHPTRPNAFTCWSTVTSARQTNYGTRLDYILADRSLAKACFTDSIIQPSIEGSDHCPVSATLICDILPCKRCPSLCTKYWPEFSGRQVKLSAFLQKSQSSPVATKPELCEKNTEVNLKRKLDKPNTSSVKQKNIMGYFKMKEAKDDRKQSNSNAHIHEECRVEQNVSGELKEPMMDKSKSSSSNAWKQLLTGLPPPPLCKGHREPCVLRVVKKQGPNFKRQFYTCAKPEGHSSNPDARCNFFQWMGKKKTKN